MSQIVARMQKLKSSNLGGIYYHNERIFKNHSNKKIDPSKTHLNYELTDRNKELTYKKQITDFIDEMDNDEQDEITTLIDNPNPDEPSEISLFESEIISIKAKFGK